jgi:hypothetical protein
VPPPPQGPGRRPRVAVADSRSVQGTIERLTVAPMGEVDGAVLDNGTVIHWPPHLADRFAAIVARGDRVNVSGLTATGPAGDTHFECQTIRNLRTNAIAAANGNLPVPGPSAALAADGASDFARSDG